MPGPTARLTLAARGGIGCDGVTDANTEANSGEFGGFGEAVGPSTAVPLAVVGPYAVSPSYTNGSGTPKFKNVSGRRCLLVLYEQTVTEPEHVKM